MSKIKYHKIKSLQNIQHQKDTLKRKINVQERELRKEWAEIKNPFKKYVTIAQSAAKTLTLIPVLIDSFMVGKKIFSLFADKKKKE